MKYTTLFKKKLRSFYYLFLNGSTTTIQQPLPLKGLKWIIDQRYGRAYFKGYYEPDIVKFFVQNVKNGDVFFDVGGHAGYFSYLFSRLSPSGRVFTFEPDGQNSDFIKRMIALNGIRNIELVSKGVGSEEGELLFHPGNTSSTGKVAKNGSVSVPVTTIDLFLSEIKAGSSVFLKIDVEGFGGEVIKGAKRFIERHKPVLLMELHEESNEREILMGLAVLGYQFYNLNESIEDVSNNSCRFCVAKLR